MSISVEFCNDVKTIRNKVFMQVALHKWNGDLDENLNSIPYTIIDGVSPQFRCCVYKEREVIRQRICLAMGKNFYNNEECNSLITVLPAACEGCPITRFQVTENCQKCLAKKCLNACPFGAISITGKGAYIDRQKCRECGRCVSSCPYNAIADLVRPCKKNCPVDAISIDNNGIAKIDDDKCVKCGHCITGCPFGAITDSSSLCNVIDEIKSSNRKVVAIIAPAIEGQFGEKVNLSMIKNAILELGFDEVVEAAMGADAVSVHEAKELVSNVRNNVKMTTSCCPAFVNLIKKYYPKLEGNISHTVSPMIAAARYIKNKDKNIKTVFIGPCIAKKHEAQQSPDDIDYVITFEELLALLNSRDVDFNECEESLSAASIYARRFAQSGGVFDAVLQAVSEINVDSQISVSCKKCNGVEECKKSLVLMGAGRLTEDIIEGMACEMGCIAGPSALVTPQKARITRERKLGKVEKTNILNYVNDTQMLNLDLNNGC